jgi:integrase
MPRSARPRWNPTRRRWYANIGDPDPGGRRREVFAPEAIGPRDEPGAWSWFHAERARREAEAEAVPSAPDEPTVEWVCEHYLAWAERRRDEGRLSPEHYRSKEYHVGLLLDHLGERPAQSLRPDDMNTFIAALQACYSPNYVANICATADAALNWAVRAGHLAANPVKGHEPPTVPRAPQRYAERAEAAAFLRHWRTRSDRRSVAGRYDRLTILLERVLVRTGARPGELCKLWWSDIRWDGGTTAAGHPFAKAVIPPERWKSGGKTGKPRTIYFSPALTRALRRELARADRHPVHVFVHGRGRGGKGAGEPWESGSRLSKKILAVRREAIARAEALEAAGRPTRGLELIRDEGHERLTNYRWRHTAISTLVMMGVDVPTVAELTGTSPEMIYRVYGHLLDRHLREAAQKLAGRAAGIRRGPAGGGP